MTNKKPIAIASDHAAFELKEFLKKNQPHWDWLDLGPANLNRVDYPDFAARVAKKIQEQEVEYGVLICGSGIGMSIAANKFAGIRAALVENPVSARLAREHNNANILCLGARIVAPEYASEILVQFLRTPFTDDPRHIARLEKISAIEINE